MSGRILIVEDHELLAESLGLALRSDGFEVEVVRDLTPGGVLGAADRFQPTVALLDLHLGDEVGSGLAVIEPLSSQGVAVVIITGETDRVQLAECVEAGALGIVNKSEPFEHLVESITEVGQLRSLLTPAQRDELLAELRRQRADDERRRAIFARLTPREQQVLAALMEGNSAEAIAEDWVVSLATVRSQIRALLQKLGVNSQLGAVALARREEWEPSGE